MGTFLVEAVICVYPQEKTLCCRGTDFKNHILVWLPVFGARQSEILD